MNFDRNELVDMLSTIFSSDENCLLAARIYRQKFPERRQPQRKTLENLLERFKRTGSVAYEKREREKQTLNEQNEFNVLLSVTADPHISTRAVSSQIGISKTSVNKILVKHKMHPYHLQRHQELLENDYQMRVNFCEWALDRINNQNDFFDFVLIGDEAVINKNGFVNRRNYHHYSNTNPYVIRTHSQNRWSINVWGGIIGDYVVGPHFFEERVTGEVYLNFLRNHLPRLMQHIPLNIRHRMWILHDGAPVHHSQMVRNYLNVEYPNRWIGRDGPVMWPPRSPDLSKIDFYLWGHVRDEVTKQPPTTRQDMEERIRRVFSNITVDTLRSVQRSFENRLQHCVNVGGGHFEHIL